MKIQCTTNFYFWNWEKWEGSIKSFLCGNCYFACKYMYIVYEDFKLDFDFTFHWNKNYTLFLNLTFIKVYCTWLSYICSLVPWTFVQSNIPSDVPWWQVLGFVQFSFTTSDLKITNTSRKVPVSQNSCPGKIWNTQQNQRLISNNLMLWHKENVMSKQSRTTYSHKPMNKFEVALLYWYMLHNNKLLYRN